MRVVFMGTPPFAAVSFKKLMGDGFDVKGVFTQPDRKSGRGMKLSFPPVKEEALKHGIPVFQPSTLRDGEAIGILRGLRPDILAVVAYGRLLPDEMLALPQYGAVNLHASLLPKYRGAAPIQHAVLNGDLKTGVTTIYLESEMDAGDMIYAEETGIGELETAGELSGRLSVIGAELLARTLRDIDAGTAPRRRQNGSEATYAPPLDKGLSPIDWSLPPRMVIKHICGLQPWPVATAEFEGELLRVFRAEPAGNATNRKPGRIISAGKEGIEVACGGGGSVLITEVQPAGKKRMRAADWLLGHPLKAEA